MGDRAGSPGAVCSPLLIFLIVLDLRTPAASVTPPSNTPHTFATSHASWLWGGLNLLQHIRPHANHAPKPRPRPQRQASWWLVLHRSGRSHTHTLVHNHTHAHTHARPHYLQMRIMPTHQSQHFIQQTIHVYASPHSRAAPCGCTSPDIPRHTHHNTRAPKHTHAHTCTHTDAHMLHSAA